MVALQLNFWDSNKKWKRHSLQTYLLLRIGLFILMPLCVALIMLGFYIQNMVQSDTIKDNDTIVTQIAGSTDEKINEINYATSMFMMNSNVMNALEEVNAASSGYLEYEARNFLSEELGTIEESTLNSFNGEIAVLTANGYLISQNNLSQAKFNYLSSRWYNNIIRQGQVSTWDPEIYQAFSELEPEVKYKPYSDLYFGRVVKGYSGNYLGIILVKLSGHSASLGFRNAVRLGGLNYSNFYIINTDKTVQAAFGTAEDARLAYLLSCENIWKAKPGVIIHNFGNRKYFYSAIRQTHSPCIYIYISEKNNFFNTSYTITHTIWLIIIVTDLLMAIVLIMLSKQITKPIRSIIKQIDLSESGIVNLTNIGPSITEIQKLIKSYNSAGVRIKELLAKVKEETEIEEKTYYELLISKISPHFIFNTVNSLQWIAENNSYQRLIEPLKAFGEILKSVYKNSNGITTIGEEIKLVSAYVKIMQLRFEYPFRYVDIIPSELYLYEIPAFSLQPIVENSILHGIRSSKLGQIVVSAIEHSQSIDISVFDNGTNPDLEKIKASIINMNERGKGTVTSIGISNINQRLKRLYGDEYGIVVNTERICGCEILIRIPKILRDGESLK